MRKTFGWISTVIVAAAVLAVPALAHEKDNYYDYGRGSNYHAVAPQYGRESRERLERDRRAQLERERLEHRGWNRDWR